MLGGAFFYNLHDIISIDDYFRLLVCGNLQIIDVMDDEILFEPVNPGILCINKHIEVLEEC